MRFHFGVSFRPKNLKKFIFPILLGILAYFGFGFFGFIKVFASNNYNSQYNINIPNFDEYFSQYTCGTENVKDFLHNFINNYNYNPHILIIPFVDYSNGNAENNSIMFLAYSRNNTQYNRFSFYAVQNGTVKTGYLFNANNSFSTSKQYILNLDTCDSNISTSSSWLAFENFLSSVVSSSNVSDNVGTYKSAGSSNTTFTRSGGGLSFDNTNSFDIYSQTGENFYKSFAWPYWSDRSLQYKATLDSVYSSSTAYFKKLYIVNNDTSYNYLDYDIPTFWDIKSTFPDDPEPSEPTFLNYRNSIDTLYTNLSPNDISNYNLKYSFKLPLTYFTTQDYIDNINFNYSCHGRYQYTDPNDNSGSSIYTYHNLDCSLNTSYTLTNDTINFTFNNLSITDNISNYDKIYVSIIANYYDSSISSVLYGVNYTYSLGSFFNSQFRGWIYEDFSNLPPHFELLVSGSGETFLSNVSVYKPEDIYNVKFYGYSISSRKQKELTIIGRSILSCSQTGNCDNTSYGLTGDGFITFVVNEDTDNALKIGRYESTLVLPKLYLFFNTDTALSFGSGSEFYYYENYAPTHNTFTEPIPVNNDDYSETHNMNTYLGYVSSFLDNISSECYYLSTIVQNVYDGFPLFLQTSIFVLFIMFCMYFLFKLIMR